MMCKLRVTKRQGKVMLQKLSDIKEEFSIQKVFGVLLLEGLPIRKSWDYNCVQ